MKKGTSIVVYGFCLVTIIILLLGSVSAFSLPLIDWIKGLFGEESEISFSPLGTCLALETNLSKKVDCGYLYKPETDAYTNCLSITNSPVSVPANVFNEGSTNKIAFRYVGGNVACTSIQRPVYYPNWETSSVGVPVTDEEFNYYCENYLGCKAPIQIAPKLPENMTGCEKGLVSVPGVYESGYFSEISNVFEKESIVVYSNKGGSLSEPYIFTDYCISNEFLNEFVCANGSGKNIVYSCPKGCVDGICSYSYCNDSDAWTTYSQYSRGTALNNLSNKIRYLVSQEQVYNLGYIENVAVSGLNENPVLSRVVDNCYNSTLLFEHYCISNSQSSEIPIKINCPYGCENGACRRTPAKSPVIKSYLDSDGIVCYCDSCTGCTSKLTNASCSIVKLTKDVNSSSNCIINPPANKIFDCQGYKIVKSKSASTGSNGYYGIYLNGGVSNGLQIKNCEVSGWIFGIEIRNTNNVIVNSSKMISNRYGIEVYNSSNIYLYDVLINQSLHSGLFIQGIVKVNSYNLDSCANSLDINNFAKIGSGTYVFMNTRCRQNKTYNMPIGTCVRSC